MAFMPDPVSTSGESIQCLGAEEYAALGRVWLEGGCVALTELVDALRPERAVEVAHVVLVLVAHVEHHRSGPGEGQVQG